MKNSKDIYLNIEQPFLYYNCYELLQNEQDIWNIWNQGIFWYPLLTIYSDRMRKLLAKQTINLQTNIHKHNIIRKRSVYCRVIRVPTLLCRLLKRSKSLRLPLEEHNTSVCTVY